jgi:hypothetical protein
MSRTPSARTATAVTTAVVLTAVLTSTGVAGAAVDAGKEVFVTNDASRPVPTRATGTTPVTGTVQVGNLPSTQAVTGTVEVGNLPETQAVTGTVGLDPAANTVRTKGQTVIAFQDDFCLGTPSAFSEEDTAEIGPIDVSPYESVRVLISGDPDAGTSYSIDTLAGPVVAHQLAAGQTDDFNRAVHVLELPGTSLRITLVNRGSAGLGSNCPDVVVWGR